MRLARDENLVTTGGHVVMKNWYNRHNAYSAQLELGASECFVDNCTTVGNLGEVGLCEYHAYVETFRRFLECKENVRYLFGTLTFAPRSVSPTNKYYKYDEVAKGVFDDPPVGIQAGERNFINWKDSLVEAMGWRLRKLLAVTEYGTSHNTGRLHIHYIIGVSDYFGELKVPELIEFIRTDRNVNPPQPRWKRGFVDIQEVVNGEGALNYLCKYISKDQDLKESRFWVYDGEEVRVPLRHVNPGTYQPALYDHRTIS